MSMIFKPYALERLDKDNWLIIFPPSDLPSILYIWAKGCFQNEHVITILFLAGKEDSFLVLH